jgi:hypothetical protein
LDEAKVRSDPKIFYEGEIFKEGAADGAKLKTAPETIFQEEAPGAAVTNSNMPKHQLLGGGGFLGLARLRLLGGGGLVLAESKAGGAEQEREAEHRGHDLFHRVCFSLIMSTTQGRLATPSCQSDMNTPLRGD